MSPPSLNISKYLLVVMIFTLISPKTVFCAKQHKVKLRNVLEMPSDSKNNQRVSIHGGLQANRFTDIETMNTASGKQQVMSLNRFRGTHENTTIACGKENSVTPCGEVPQENLVEYYTVSKGSGSAEGCCSTAADDAIIEQAERDKLAADLALKNAKILEENAKKSADAAKSAISKRDDLNSRIRVKTILDEAKKKHLRATERYGITKAQLRAQEAAVKHLSIDAKNAKQSLEESTEELDKAFAAFRSLATKLPSVTLAENLAEEAENAIGKPEMNDLIQTWNSAKSNLDKNSTPCNSSGNPCENHNNEVKPCNSTDKGCGVPKESGDDTLHEFATDNDVEIDISTEQIGSNMKNLKISAPEKASLQGNSSDDTQHEFATGNDVEIDISTEKIGSNMKNLKIPAPEKASLQGNSSDDTQHDVATGNDVEIEISTEDIGSNMKTLKMPTPEKTLVAPCDSSVKPCTKDITDTEDIGSNMKTLKMPTPEKTLVAPCDSSVKPCTKDITDTLTLVDPCNFSEAGCVSGEHQDHKSDTAILSTSSKDLIADFVNDTKKNS